MMAHGNPNDRPTTMHRSLVALLAAALLTGCESITPSFYQLDVRQGNVIEQEQLAQLHPGMTRRQVQSVLGTPLIADPFHQDRWDYVYLYYPDGDTEDGEERHVTLFFEGDVLSRMNGDVQPSP